LKVTVWLNSGELFVIAALSAGGAAAVAVLSFSVVDLRLLQAHAASNPNPPSTSHTSFFDGCFMTHFF
jgi:hypothetical protein